MVIFPPWQIFEIWGEWDMAYILLVPLPLGYTLQIDWSFLHLLKIWIWFYQIHFPVGGKFINSFLWNLCILYIIDFLFKLLYSSWKLDSVGMAKSSVGLFLDIILWFFCLGQWYIADCFKFQWDSMLWTWLF